MPKLTPLAPDQQRLTTRAIEAEIRRVEEVLKKKAHEKKQTIDQLNEIAKEIVYGAALKHLANRLESLALDQDEYKLFADIRNYLKDKNKLAKELEEHADKIQAKRAEEVAAVAAEAARASREAAEKKAAEAAKPAAKQAAKPVAKPVAAAAEEDDDDESSEVDADEERDPRRVRRLDYSVVTKGDKRISEIFEKFQENKQSADHEHKKEYSNELDHAIYYALAQIHEENTGTDDIKWNDDKPTNKGRESGDGIRPRGQQRRAAYKKIADELGINFDSFKDRNTGLTDTKRFRIEALKKFKEKFPDKPASSLGLGVSGVAGAPAISSAASTGPVVVGAAGGLVGGTVAGSVPAGGGVVGAGTVAGAAIGGVGGASGGGGAGAGTVAGVVPGGGGGAVGGGGSTAAFSIAKQLVGEFGGDTQDLSRKVSPGAGAGGDGPRSGASGAAVGGGAARAGVGGASAGGGAVGGAHRDAKAFPVLVTRGNWWQSLLNAVAYAEVTNENGQYDQKKLRDKYEELLKKVVDGNGNIVSGNIMDCAQLLADHLGRQIYVIETPDEISKNKLVQISALQNLFVINPKGVKREAIFVHWNRTKRHHSAVQIPEGLKPRDFAELLLREEQAKLSLQQGADSSRGAAAADASVAAGGRSTGAAGVIGRGAAGGGGGGGKSTALGGVVGGGGDSAAQSRVGAAGGGVGRSNAAGAGGRVAVDSPAPVSAGWVDETSDLIKGGAFQVADVAGGGVGGGKSTAHGVGGAVAGGAGVDSDTIPVVGISSGASKGAGRVSSAADGSPALKGAAAGGGVRGGGKSTAPGGVVGGGGGGGAGGGAVSSGAVVGGGGADLAGGTAHPFTPSVSGGTVDVSYPAASVSPPAAAAKITSFKALKTPGDGSCLFHAIVKGLELGAAKSIILTAEALRAAACDQILQWVEAGDKIHDSYALLQSGDVPLVDKMYVDRMRQTTTYAGELEMLALATKYARPIVVITVPYVSVGESGKDIQMSEIGSIRVTRDETKGGKLEIDKAIFVVYDGKRANDAHYSAVELPPGVTKQAFYEQLQAAQQENTAKQKAGPAAAPPSPARK